MATRLHKLMAALDKQKDPTWDNVKAVLARFSKDAKQFDFGDEEKCIPAGSREPVFRYACELGEHDLLRLPYQFTYFASSSMLDNKTRLDDCYLCIQDDDNKAILITNFGYVPSAEMIIYNFGIRLNLNDCTSQVIDAYTLKCEKQLNLFYYEVPKKDEIDEAQNWVVQTVLCYIGLLESPSVEIRTVGASSSLNKRRAKQGLPPINEVNEVHIRLNGVRYTTGGTVMGGGSTKSAHWRRGHVRRLKSGTVTNVRPCLVAFTGNENVPEQVYKVTA